MFNGLIDDFKVRLDLTLKAMIAGAIVGFADLQLAEQVWHADLIAIDNLIDVHMKNLRRKVDPPGMPVLIQTVRGQGFRLSAQAGTHD